MPEEFSRTELLIGKEKLEKLKSSHVAIFGIGGVGGYVVEALARVGIEHLDFIDNDVVSASNINRQIHALHSTIGQYKVDVAKERCLDINKNMIINTYKTFFLLDNKDAFDFSQYDYVVDAIDTVSGKIAIAIKANEANVSEISAMGAGNKLNATMFEVADIYETSVCPLAKVMRRELKKYNIDHLKVVYSKEEPISQSASDDIHKDKSDCHPVPGSISFVPPVVGMIIAGEVVHDLTQ